MICVWCNEPIENDEPFTLAWGEAIHTRCQDNLCETQELIEEEDRQNAHS